MKETNFIFQTPAIHLEKLKDYFLNAGWSPLGNSEENLFTDGSCVFFLNPDSKSRPGLIYLATEDERRPDAFKKIGDQWVSSSPSNVLIIWQIAEPVKIPESAPSLFGNNAGLSIETLHLEESIRFFRQMGLNPKNSDFSHGFVELVHSSGFSMALIKFGICPHSFVNPSLSFFNGKEGNKTILEEIRNKQIPIYEEVSCFNPDGVVDNIIIREPGGFGFFIFND